MTPITFTPKQFERFRRSAFHNGVAEGSIHSGRSGCMCFLGHAYNGKIGRKPRVYAGTAETMEALPGVTDSDEFQHLWQESDDLVSSLADDGWTLTDPDKIQQWIDGLAKAGVYEVVAK